MSYAKKSLNKENSKNPVVRNPSKEGLQSILDAADIRKDKVYDLLWPVKDDILALKQKVLFHKNCRANYTSQRNLQSGQKELRNPFEFWKRKVKNHH